MPLNKKLPIAISMGEPGGINIEIIFKCIKKKLPVFFLIADPDWVAKCITVSYTHLTLPTSDLV